MENLYEYVCDKIKGIETQTDDMGLSEDSLVTEEEEKLFYEMRAYMLGILNHVKTSLETQAEEIY